MANPRPLMALSFVDEFGPDRTVPGGETIIGQGIMPVQSRVAGAALDVDIIAYLIVPTGSVTLRLRQSHPTTGTIMATLIQGVTAGGIFTGTGSYIPSGSPERMYLTGISEGATVTIKMATMMFAGDEVPEPPPDPPDPSDLVTSSVELLSQDTVLLTFAGNVQNDVLLRDPTNYTVTAVGGGIPVRVKDVLTGSPQVVDQVVLVLTRPSLGEIYEVTASGMLDEDGLVLDPTTKQFVVRLTKMDHVLKGLPAMYSREHRSTLRSLLQAFSRVDERIGGNRSDSLS